MEVPEVNHGVIGKRRDTPGAPAFAAIAPHVRPGAKIADPHG